MIKVETSDRITRIELARPEKKNALTLDMYGAMADALAAADQDPAVRAVLIHGARDCFTAGNDLKDFLERPPHSQASPAFRFISTLPVFAKPLVAAVNGPAVGIGTTLLLHCDLVYAAPGARFQLPFVPLGLVPEAGSSFLLPYIAGYQRAAAAAVAALPPAAVRAAKALMRKHFGERTAQAMEEEGRIFRERLASPEAKEAMSAFLEKRKPDFSRF